jgi:hypothetical protein
VDEREAHHLEKEAQHPIVQREKLRKTDLECDPVLVDAKTKHDPDRRDLIVKILKAGQHPVGVTVHALTRQGLVQAR